MMKFPIRKIGTKLSIKRSYKTGDKLFFLFLLFLFGMFFGSMASSNLFAERLSIDGGIKALIDLASILFLLFLSTSYLGCFFIPIIVAARGFIFSAYFSSLCFFSLSNGFLKALWQEAIPLLIILPSFFLVAFDCSLHSSRLLHRGRDAKESDPQLLKHLLICVFFLALDLVYCLYFLPIIYG